MKIMGSETAGLQRWDRPSRRLEIGRALLAASEPLTAAQLKQATGRTNIKRDLDRLVDAGLVDDMGPPAYAHEGAGRPTMHSYRLAHGEAERVEQVVGGSALAGRFAPGQELVIAGGGDREVADLLSVLGESQQAAQATWAAMFGDGWVLAFDGPQRGTTALTLVAELTGAQVSAHRATVAWIGSGPSAVLHARAASAMRRAQSLRGAGINAERGPVARD